MGRVLTARGAAGSSGRWVFLASPIYEKPSPDFAHSILLTGIALQRAGIGVIFEQFVENCHVDDSRNRLVRDFLLTEADDLFFLDADVQWEPQDLLRILELDRDIVGAVYPLKEDVEAYPVDPFPGELRSDDEGLIQVKRFATGFMRIRRHVLETLAGQARTFPAKDDHFDTPQIPLIFERTLLDDEHGWPHRWGGDLHFCNLASAQGFKLYIDPMMRFTHVGPHRWSGSVGEHWRNQADLTIPDCLEQIRTATDDGKTYAQLLRAWGNGVWAIAPDLAASIAMMAREAQGPILECGSGISTLILAAASDQPIHVLEHDPLWAQKTRMALDKYLPGCNVTVECRPISDSWYNARDLPENIGMLVVDGPPRHLARRENVFDWVSLAPGCLIAMDDAGDLTEIEVQTGITFHRFNGIKPYALARTPEATPQPIGAQAHG